MRISRLGSVILTLLQTIEVYFVIALTTEVTFLLRQVSLNDNFPVNPQTLLTNVKTNGRTWLNTRFSDRVRIWDETFLRPV